MEKSPIDTLKGFTKHLGKARTDRIRYHQKGTGRKQAGATNIENTVIEAMQKEELKDRSFVSDILVGAARADHHSKPLSVGRIYAVLQCMKIINTREVCLMMGINERQAQRYVRAIKFALPFLIRAFNKRKENAKKEEIDKESL